MMKTVALLILGLGIAMPPAAFAQDTKDDEDLIHGSWELKSSQDGGEEDPSTKGLVLILENGKLTAKIGDEVKGTGTYKLNPSKTPKWSDITIGDDAFLGIYELKGDSLRICHGRPGDMRSTQFASEAGSPNEVLTILNRKKK